MIAPAEVGVQSAGQHLGQHANGRAPALHPSHKTWVAIAAAKGSHVSHELRVSFVQSPRGPGQRHTIARTRLGRRSLPEWARPTARQIIEHVVEHPMALGPDVGPVIWI